MANDSSRHRRLARPWTIAALGAAVLLVVAFALARAAHDPLADLQTAAIGRGDIEETVTALGKLEPHTYVDVGAQVSGQLKRILVQPGATVKAGDLLAEIDPQLQAAKVDADRAQLAGLRADLADTQAQAEFAAGEFKRQTVLKREDATRDDTFAQARRDMRSTAAKVDQVRAQIAEGESTLKADQAQLGYTRIFAPMAGTVVSVDAREGQTINANYSAPVLLRIADLSTMTVWTQVSEADVTRLHEGMALYFTTLGFGDRRWTGTLRQVLPAPPKPASASGSTDSAAAPTQPGAGNVVLYTGLFDVANPKGELRPEMSAQVFFVAAAAKGALTAPMAALTPKDAAAGLYTARVVSGGRLASREVRIGVHDRFTAEVLSGLAAGDQVVTGVKPEAEKPSLIGFRL